MSEFEGQPKVTRTIATPLPKVSGRLIQRRSPAKPDHTLREPNSFENAVQAGDVGLIGTDGSGMDWEFSQNLGNAALHELQTDEYAEGDQ